MFDDLVFELLEITRIDKLLIALFAACGKDTDPLARTVFDIDQMHALLFVSLDRLFETLEISSMHISLFGITRIFRIDGEPRIVAVREIDHVVAFVPLVFDCITQMRQRSTCAI